VIRKQTKKYHLNIKVFDWTSSGKANRGRESGTKSRQTLNTRYDPIRVKVGQ
jgi:hypothetical protein